MSVRPTGYALKCLITDLPMTSLHVVDTWYEVTHPRLDNRIRARKGGWSVVMGEDGNASHIER